MTIQECNGKTICVLGYGKEGQSIVKALETYAPDARITIADGNENLEIPDTQHQVRVGEGWLENLEAFDVVIKSPGIPPRLLSEQVQKTFTSSTQIFLDTAKEKGSTIIGVTGSKGKSTTSSLIYEALKADGRDVHLVGNIGYPTLDYLEHLKPDAYFVQEMSSYQLMNLQTAPSIAVITSFFPEHLDYHGTLEEYLDAKAQLTKKQTTEDIVFYDDYTIGPQVIAEHSPGTKIATSAQDAIVPLTDLQIIGTHNLRNSALATKVALHLGVSEQNIRTGFCAFQGLKHRLQSLGIHHGIEWIDDAISTTPESAIAALDSLGDGVQTIILGGQDRGNDFTELGKRIAESNIEHVVLFPESGERIREAIEKSGSGSEIRFYNANSMSEAVTYTKEVVAPNPTTEPDNRICLLSTASPSYNMFKNYEEKGDKFAEEIHK